MYILEKSNLIYSVWKHLQREKVLSPQFIKQEEYYKNSCSKEQHIQSLFFTLLHHYANHERVESMLIALGMDGVFTLKKKELLYNEKPLSPSVEPPKGNLKQQRAFLLLHKAYNEKEARLYYKEAAKHIDSLCGSEYCTIKQNEILCWLAKEIQKSPLKRICKLLHVSQKGLADSLHVSEVTVNRWSGNAGAIPPQSLRMFDILEENSILKAKQKKTQELLEALRHIEESY